MSGAGLSLLIYLLIGVILINIAEKQAEKDGKKPAPPLVYMVLVMAWPLVVFFAIQDMKKKRGR
jgi:hypothetical protein